MSRASKIIIDHATQRAIEQGKVDLRYASPALQQIAAEIRYRYKRNRGFSLRSLFGGGRDSVDEEMDDIKQSMQEQETENARLEREHQGWAQQHRSKSAPRDWTLLTDDGRGVQTYSDGNQIHYYSGGKEMSWAEESAYVSKHYGDGDD